jgi:GTP-binding protein
LLDEVTSNLSEQEEQKERLTQLTIIGKPNVGKSSLLNSLTKQTRSIVSNIPGTTRDSTSSLIEINDKTYEIIDTAGISKKSKLVEAVEHYALIRAMNSLDNSDIALLVIDSTNELTKFDARIMGYALEKNKPIILVINK